MSQGSLGAAWKRWRPGVIATAALHGGAALALALKIHNPHPIVAPPSFAVEMVSAPAAAEPHPEAPPEQPRQSPAPMQAPLPPIARPPPAPSDVAMPPPPPARPAPPQPPASAAPPPAAAVAIAPTNRVASSSSVDPKAQLSWESDVLARLDAAKRYPPTARFARQEATIQVQFEVDRRGRVITCRLVRASGISDLDDEVLALLKRVRLPPPPSIVPDGELKLTVPIEFSIKHD